MPDSAGNRLAVVGTGLIGGSLLLRLHQAGHEVIGWDPRAETRDLGRSWGLRFADRLDEAVADRAVVFLCGPLVALPEILSEVAKATSDDCVVTDVGSTKLGVTEAARQAGLGHRFVAGHPMAGTENAGLASARPDLLVGAPWVLCPDPAVDPVRYRALVTLVTDVFEARVAPMEAGFHDEVVALSSHVPHVLAGALAGAVARSPVREGVLSLAAGSFRDGTRVAGTPSARTADMALQNRRAVLRQINLVRSVLDELAGNLERDDADAVLSQFESSRAVRLELLSRRMSRVERRFDGATDERSFLVAVGEQGGYLTDCSVEAGTVVYRALLPEDAPVTR
ncbi:prephenate dehydrogenase [Mangrovihabitans endophyticus]|uniref:Prephenate dehydrogenase n=1 Tax=Mangrovihabitans endophyticus TaxID=1751298 RepID=A0A8J3C3R0_9ACTN|nr:prephenate dehydrogenase/arogenate dehydrogenase family protein [Mangrovihabitans endophyticus]GGL04864.1 prephenate dehydrogenase [Mangrovihabitans endophyticus]